MQIIFNYQNIDKSDSLESFIEKKLSNIEKVYDISEVDVKVKLKNSENLKYIFECTLKFKHHLFRVEDQGKDLYKLVTSSLKKLSRKIAEFNEKLVKSRKTNDVIASDSVNDEEYELEFIVGDSSELIVKRKFYDDDRPLHPEEAINQMELLGHTSFLFKNIENNKYAMVYKRKDKKYGIIQPTN